VEIPVENARDSGNPAVSLANEIEEVQHPQDGRIGGTGVSGVRGGRCRFHFVSSS
jgi:hypothetical protein